MMPGLSEMWEEIGGGGAGRLSGGGFNAVAPWRFEALSENTMADLPWICQSSSHREMESLTRALQRELSSANYENELSFAASSLNSDWKCKAERKLSSAAEITKKNNVTEMMNFSNGGFEVKEKEMRVIEVEKGLNLSKAEQGKSLLSGGGSEIESLKGKNSNSLSVNGAGKVSKRKSRAASKTPITFLNADPANFRTMVQQVTGVPLNPNATRLWPPSAIATCSVRLPALLKPEPKRPSSSSSAASIIQGLPTLDTSALFIHSARQNLASASDSAAEFRPFSSAAAPSNEILLTEKFRAACMQSLTKNNGGGADFAMDQESGVNIVATEADSWINASNLEGILSGSNFELARSSPM